MFVNVVAFILLKVSQVMVINSITLVLSWAGNHWKVWETFQALKNRHQSIPDQEESAFAMSPLLFKVDYVWTDLIFKPFAQIPEQCNLTKQSGHRTYKNLLVVEGETHSSSECTFPIGSRREIRRGLSGNMWLKAIALMWVMQDWATIHNSCWNTGLAKNIKF